MRRMRADDLFEMFPDLPRPRHGRSGGLLINVQRQVEAARARVRANIIKQRAKSRIVQAAISARRRR